MKNSRRNFLQKSAIAAGSTLLFPNAVGAHNTILKEPFDQKKKRALRIAHITDCHVIDNAACINSMKRVYEQLNAMEDKPEIIINSGDIIMDANYKDLNHANKLWDLWFDLSKDNDIPIHYCPGNHDYWWPESNDKNVLEKAKAENPNYDLGLYLSRSKTAAPYYSFEKKGWKFISLNSMGSWYGLGDVQTNWLISELNTNTFSCLFSHVPIISVAPLLYSVNRSDPKEIRYPGDQHKDAKALKDLFYKFNKVKLCLSGHIHYIDAVEYLGVKYICSGAASSNWWEGVLDEFPNAYTLIDLNTDGTTEHKYVFYSE
ncbi:MAG: metallophosphoesterase [Bacteroidetes bacterium]|nr:metallophosphoesterase [Bacteroidota bacterium]